MSHYSPIDCAAHSELELLAMRRSIVKLRFDAGDQQEVTGWVVDVYVRDGAEYLQLVDARESVHEVRLDKIISFERS